MRICRDSAAVPKITIKDVAPGKVFSWVGEEDVYIRVMDMRRVLNRQVFACVDLYTGILYVTASTDPVIIHDDAEVRV